jgi:hypothetical protein
MFRLPSGGRSQPHLCLAQACKDSRHRQRLAWRCCTVAARRSSCTFLGEQASQSRRAAADTGQEPEGALCRSRVYRRPVRWLRAASRRFNSQNRLRRCLASAAAIADCSARCDANSKAPAQCSPSPAPRPSSANCILDAAPLSTQPRTGAVPFPQESRQTHLGPTCSLLRITHGGQFDLSFTAGPGTHMSACSPRSDWPMLRHTVKRLPTGIGCPACSPS